MSNRSRKFLLIVSALSFVFLAIVVIFSDFSKVNLTQKFEKLSGQEVTQGEGEVKVLDEKVEDEIFLEIVNPKDNDTVKSSSLNVSGKTLPGIDVFVNEKELKAKSDGSFSINISIDEGENSIVVIVNDDFGNYIEKELTVTLESF